MIKEVGVFAVRLTAEHPGLIGVFATELRSDCLPLGSFAEGEDAFRIGIHKDGVALAELTA